MALRSNAMGAYGSEQTDEAWHLLRKVFLLLLVVTASALGLVLLARRSYNVPLVMFNILADASLGLLIGLAARYVLRQRSPWIQSIASAALSLVGLAILGYFTNWRSGLGPLGVGWVSVHWLDALHVALRLPVQFRSSPMDLLDLVHAAVAIDTSWIALRVWKQNGPSRTSTVSPAPARRAHRAQRPAASAAQPAASVPARHVPASAPSNTRSRSRRRKIERPAASRSAVAVRPGRTKSRRIGGSRQRHPAVRLAVHEEHQCPYCLTPVTRNDPRGVVECQICHTLHHKDCWDITGNCQVPHLTTL